MLLQITNPNFSTDETQRIFKPVIGIDLGTTNSVVSYLNKNNNPTIILIDGAPLMPSVAASVEGHIVVGKAAMLFDNAFYSFKRLMCEPSNPCYNGLTPVELSAHVLRKIRDEASSALQEDITDAVITVPAYFNDTQRQATKDAAKIAGLNVLRLLNEPTSAAVSLGLDTLEKGTYLVYDLGGGTFDVSILKMREGIFRVLSTNGDTFLGGDDIDSNLLKMLKIEDLSQNRSQVRILKEMLSQEETVNRFGLTMTRQDLEKASHDLINGTLTICDQAIKDAQITRDEIDSILLVGGATRTYGLSTILSNHFNIPVRSDFDPDLCVSFGAAIQAHALTQGAQHVLMDVTPLSLGIETIGGIFEKIIHKNTPIPVAMAQEFTTYQDGQTALKIHILQGEREMIADCRSIGQFTLKGIPPMPAGLARIKITFRLDVDGVLTVEAEEKHTNLHQSLEVKPTYGLSEEKLIEMIYTAHANATTDMHQRLLTQSIVQANHLLGIVQKALEKDSALISTKDLEKLMQIMRLLEDAIAGRDREKISTFYDDLAKASQNFADRRIENAIKKQLVGEEIEL